MVLFCPYNNTNRYVLSHNRNHQSADPLWQKSLYSICFIGEAASTGVNGHIGVDQSFTPVTFWWQHNGTVLESVCLKAKGEKCDSYNQATTQECHKSDGFLIAMYLAGHQTVINHNATLRWLSAWRIQPKVIKD